MTQTSPTPGESRTLVRAAVLNSAGTQLTIEQLAMDDWLAPDEVRVKVDACGLCHSDLHALDGEMPVPLPTVPGHEVAGTVEAIGSNVQNLAVGDRVVGCLSMFCGHCEECRAGQTYICVRRNDLGRSDRPAPRFTLGDTPVGQMAGIGGLAERTIMHQNSLVRVSAEVPADRAGLLGCAVLTGVSSVINGAKVRPGESVVVIGVGGVGLNAIQGARLAAATTIIAVDLSDENLELARTFGATHTINAGNGDPIAAVKEILPAGADHVFDVVGRGPTVAQAVGMLRQGRTVWILGIAPYTEQLTLPAMPLVVANKGIQGLLMGNNHFPRDIPLLADLYLQGRLELDALLTRTIKLDEANDGFEQMRAGAAGRVAVVF